MIQNCDLSMASDREQQERIDSFIMERNVEESKVEPRKNSLRSRKKVDDSLLKPASQVSVDMTTLEQAEEILDRI